MRVIIAPRAARDLKRIGDWIARDSRVNADSFVARLRLACLGLGDLPERYPIHAATGLRRRPEGNYLIFYRITDRVEIVRVMHGAQDWPNHFDDPE